MMMVMGRIAGAFGVKGWVKVQTFTQSVDTLIGFPSWWLKQAAGWQERKVEEAAVHGRTVIAKLSGVHDRDAAAQLLGYEVAVPRDQLPASRAGEYYWADLIGIGVSNIQGVPLGRVAKLLETGAQQVLLVEGERERLIPFIESVVVSVDVAGRSLVVDWDADF
jgi:16S rRNA processing protein RimM